MVIDKNKLLNLLGLAQKSGNLVSGTDTVIENLKADKLFIVFVGNDSSEKTIDNFKRKCYFYHVEVNLDFSSNELSQAIGKERAIIGIADKGFFNAIKKYIRGENDESKGDSKLLK